MSITNQLFILFFGIIVAGTWSYWMGFVVEKYYKLKEKLK